MSTTSLIRDNPSNNNFDINQYIENTNYLNTAAFYQKADNQKALVQSSTFDPLGNYENEDEEEELKYLIKDLDTGKVYDQRNIEQQKESLVDEK